MTNARFSRRAIGAASIVLLAAGCSSRVTPIGPGFVYEPDESETRLWEASRDFAAGVSAPGVVYDDPELEKYVQGVLERVLGNNLPAYLPLRPRVRFIDSAAPNAFALSHGDVFLHTGVLGRMRSEGQLAFLLGHEITHATHRHMYQRLEHKYTATGTLSYVSVLSTLGGGNIQRLVSGVTEFITQAAISGYSRDKEREADRVGLTLMAQAGYDPHEGARMWQQMLDATDPKDREWHFLYATHPKMKERAKDAKKLVERMPPELLAHATEVGQDRYVAAAGHMILEEARTHITLGKFDLAEETLQFLAEASPEDARPFSLLGDLYRARRQDGDRQRATGAYSAALERNADDPGAHRGLGIEYMRAGRRSEALRHMKRFLELSPEAPDAEYIRSYIQKLSGGD